MPMDELTLQYRGVTVTVADQPDAGHGALGAEDIVAVQLPDGTELAGAALTQQLADPAFRERVVGVIDAYGPVLSTPFHQTGADEWPRLRRFWTTAQPEHWLRDIGRYPDLADDRQVLTRTMFLRANRSTKLPPALQEAVAVHQAIGWIREQHRTRLGLARLDTLVDQATIDAHVGPVVRGYSAAISALIRRQGESALTRDMLATTAWRDPTLQTQLPPWAVEHFIERDVPRLLDERGGEGVQALLNSEATIRAHIDHVVDYCRAALERVSIARDGAAPYHRIVGIIITAFTCLDRYRDHECTRGYFWAIDELLESGVRLSDVPPRLAFETLLTLWSTGLDTEFAERTRLAVHYQWRESSDVVPLAQALRTAVATRPQILPTYADYLLDLALMIHDRLPTAADRGALGDTIAGLLRHCEYFSRMYGQAAARREPTGPRIEAMLDTLIQHRYGNRTEDARIAARYTRWGQIDPDRIPADLAQLLDMLEHRHIPLGESFAHHLLTLDEPWFDALSSTDAQILADQFDVWWRRDPGRPLMGDMHPAVSLLYHLHNRLPTQAERERWSLRIADDIVASRRFSLAYALAHLHRLSEPTGAQLEHLLATTLQSPDVDRRHEAELARILTRRATPRGLLPVLDVLAPTSLSDGSNPGFESMLATTSWFTDLTESELARMSERLLHWYDRAPGPAWDNDSHNYRAGLLARIHNATAHQPLRNRIARFLVTTMQEHRDHYRALHLVEYFQLEEPARGEILGAYRALQADPDIATRRYVQKIELALGADLIGAALARAGNARHIPHHSLGEPEFVAAGYPHLTAEERTRIDRVVMAALTFAQTDRAGARVQAELREAFHPIRNQVSPALRRVLERDAH